MPIVGMNFSLMEAKKSDKNVTGEIKVNSTPKITEIKEVDITQLKKKALSLTFEFVTSYNPDLAEIKIGGDVLYLAENNTKILSQWKKKKSIPEDMSVEVLNHLFRRCLLKISNMADDLQLPPPITLPRVRKKGDESTEYIG
jgi:hypothetical protein